MAKPKRKLSKFKEGELVNFPVRIFSVDRRFYPPMYRIESPVKDGWLMEDIFEESEFLKRERGE